MIGQTFFVWAGPCPRPATAAQRRDSGPPSGLRPLHVAARSGAVLGAIATALLTSVASVHAATLPVSDTDNLTQIVVTAKKEPTPVVDAEIKEHVEAAMRSDKYFYDEHITVTTKNGIVTLHGIVFDDWDLRAAVRIARRVPNVKRVINDLEMIVGGE